MTQWRSCELDFQLILMVFFQIQQQQNIPLLTQNIISKSNQSKEMYHVRSAKKNDRYLQLGLILVSLLKDQSKQFQYLQKFTHFLNIFPISKMIPHLSFIFQYFLHNYSLLSTPFESSQIVACPFHPFSHNSLITFVSLTYLSCNHGLHFESGHHYRPYLLLLQTFTRVHHHSQLFSHPGALWVVSTAVTMDSSPIQPNQRVCQSKPILPTTLLDPNSSLLRALQCPAFHILILDFKIISRNWHSYYIGALPSFLEIIILFFPLKRHLPWNSIRYFK